MYHFALAMQRVHRPKRGVSLNLDGMHSNRGSLCHYRGDTRRPGATFFIVVLFSSPGVYACGTRSRYELLLPLKIPLLGAIRLSASMGVGPGDLPRRFGEHRGPHPATVAQSGGKVRRRR